MSRQHIYVRPMNPADPQDVLAAERAMEDSGNDFPAGAFRLPTTQVMIAESGGRIVMVQPFYRSLVMGSVAAVSDSDTEIASAMHQSTQTAFTDAHRFQLLDVLAFSNTELTAGFALRHGFEAVEHPAYRLAVR